MLQRSRSSRRNGMTIRHSGALVVLWDRKTVDGVDGMLAPLQFSGLGLASRRESPLLAILPDGYLESSRA